MGPVHSQSCIAQQRLRQPSAFHLAAFALKMAALYEPGAGTPPAPPTAQAALPTAYAALPGPPSLPFYLRCQQKSAHLSVAMDVFGLVILPSAPFLLPFLGCSRSHDRRVGPPTGPALPAGAVRGGAGSGGGGAPQALVSCLRILPKSWLPTGLQVIILACAHRLRFMVAPAPFAGLVHLWVYGTACAACMVWCWVAGVGPQSSYVRYMEAASLLFRLGCFGFGAAWILQR